MKYLKSTMAFLLSIGFVFSAFACGEKKNDNKESTPTDNSSTVETIPEDHQGVWEVVSAAKSAKVSIDFSQEMVDAEIKEGTSVGLDVSLAQTEKGVDAKLEVEVTNVYGEESNTQNEVFYLIDGWAYRYMEEEDAYWVSPSTLGMEIVTMLEEEGVDLAEVEAAITEVMTTLEGLLGDTQVNIGEVVNGIFEVGAKLEDGAMLVSMDYASYVNSVLDYIAELEETTKVETIINDVFALVDPELTCEKIFTEVATLGAVTVEEAYAAIDGVVAEIAGAGIQETKDMLIAMPEVQAILMEMDMNEEDIAMIAEMDIEAMLAEYFELTLNDVVRQIIMENEGDMSTSDSSYEGTDEYVDTATEEVELPEDIIGEYAMMAYEMISQMTLADVAEMMETQNLVAILKQVGSIEIVEGSFKYGVKYDNEWNVDSIIAKEAFKMNAPEGEVGYVSMYFDLVVSELSETAATIALPAGAKLVCQCYECDDYSTENETVKLSEEYGVYLCADCEAVFGYEKCECCYEKKADAKYYEAHDEVICDNCYEEYYSS